MLLLTNTQVSRLCKAFTSNSSANIKLSKTQLHKIGQSGGFRLLGPLLKTGLPLMGNVLKPFAKRILIQLRLTAAASETGTKKMFGSGFITLIISNEEIKNIMKIVISLEDSGLLRKSVGETIKMRQKTKRRTFRNVIRNFRPYFIRISTNR